TRIFLISRSVSTISWVLLITRSTARIAGVRGALFRAPPDRSELMSWSAAFAQSWELIAEVLIACGPVASTVRVSLAQPAKVSAAASASREVNWVEMVGFIKGGGLGLFAELEFEIHGPWGNRDGGNGGGFAPLQREALPGFI